ncbi:hypothetical protein V1522DRAFT_404622 [Lipomyces starkeyi]
MMLFATMLLIFRLEPHTYGHIPPSTSNVHRNPLGCGRSNAVMGADVSAGNGSLQHRNAASFLINPPIRLTSATIR